jgi:hypothetical protein
LSEVKEKHAAGAGEGSFTMGGWFVDIIVEYLYRIIARAIRTRGIAHWRIAKAKINDSSCARAIYGCHVAEVYYEYRVDGEMYTGADEAPFLFHDSGKEYVGRFAPRTEVIIRVKPSDPSISFLRAADQVLCP